VDGLDSGIGRPTIDVDGLDSAAKLSAIPVKSCVAVVLFSVFWPFDLL
jgi:hypothetical protein